MPFVIISASEASPDKLLLKKTALTTDSSVSQPIFLAYSDALSTQHAIF
jgi:hypothetical protein